MHISLRLFLNQTWISSHRFVNSCCTWKAINTWPWTSASLHCWRRTPWESHWTRRGTRDPGSTFSLSTSCDPWETVWVEWAVEIDFIPPYYSSTFSLSMYHELTFRYRLELWEPPVHVHLFIWPWPQTRENPLENWTTVHENIRISAKRILFHCRPLLANRPNWVERANLLIELDLLASSGENWGT